MNDHSSSDSEASDITSSQKCKFNFSLKFVRPKQLLTTKGREFHRVWLLKKNDFCKFLVPVFLEVKFDINDKVSRCVVRRRELLLYQLRYSGNSNGL